MATDNYGFIELDPNEKFSLVNDFNQLAQQVDAALKSIANAETENANKIATLNTNLEATNTKLSSVNMNVQTLTENVGVLNTNLEATNTNLSSVNMNVQTLTENVGVLREDIKTTDEHLAAQQLNVKFTPIEIKPASETIGFSKNDLRPYVSENQAYFFLTHSLTSETGNHQTTLIPGSQGIYGIAISKPLGVTPAEAMFYNGSYTSYKAPDDRTYYGSGQIAVGTDGIIYMVISTTPGTWLVTEPLYYVFLQTKLTLTPMNFAPEPSENADNS